MYIFFVDLGVVVYVDTEWVIWDSDKKTTRKVLFLVLKQKVLKIMEVLVLRSRVLVLVLTTKPYLHHFQNLKK